MNIQLKNLTESQTKDLLPDGLIFLAYRGSVAHGMYVPNTDPNSVDDVDLMGIFINPLNHYFGFQKRDVYEKWVGEYDTVHYELKKFVSLLLKANPNVMAMLWLNSKHVLYQSPLFARLIENRKIFVSKKAYESFTGYAYGQLKRMEHFKFDGYMGQKRKQLVEKFGYDTKNAAHLIRLLRMGIEFLDTGEFVVERPDAEYLLKIKRGEFTIDYVKKRADDLFERAKQALDQSTLPDAPDYDFAEKLLIEIMVEHHFKISANQR